MKIQALKDNPSLYMFLPMLYIVWSDAVLTHTEIKKIRNLIEDQKWLTKEEKDLIQSHLDPASPPTPQQLKGWLQQIHAVSDKLSDDTKKSLVDIGFKIAELYEQDGVDETALEARQSLYQIEEALGVISRESHFFLEADEHKTEARQVDTKASFDVNALAAVLEGDEGELINKVKRVISDPFFDYVNPEPLKDYREKVLEWCRHLAQQGYGAMAFPTEYGGGGDMRSYFTIMENLSYRDLSTVIKFGVQFGLFGMSIYFLGTKKHHEKYLKDVGTLDLPGCFAMTETGHGSNVRGIETTATYSRDEKIFTIHTPSEHARKEYIGNAAVHGQMATVFAKIIIDGTDFGVAAFLVPIRKKDGSSLPGITIKDCGRKMGLNGVDNGIIYFDNIKIPKDNMLDRFASVNDNDEFESPISSDNRRFFTMLGTLVGGRIGIPRSGLSATKTGLTIAIKYGNGRKQFGPESGAEVPILNYKTHQRRLMPLLSNAYALHFGLQYLTNRYLARTDDDVQEIEALAAGLKSFATWNTTHTLQTCRECCGGKGYLSENRIEALKNDTDVYTTFEGDNTVLMQLVAKARLSEFRHEFSNINVFGIVKYIAKQAKTSIAEKNPVAVRSTDDTHLLDPAFHLAAFRYREKDILASAGKRLKKHIDAGMDSFDAFNQCQYHLLNVGFAYIERVILEQFIGQVEATEDKGSKEILKKLSDLFALSQIEKNKGWYLEHGYMEGVKTKAIRRMVNKLCLELRQDAVPLVDAFRIPESCLAAPIATTHK